MKLSRETINLLKVYSNINTNLLIKAGSTIRTKSPQKNIVAEATIAEEFPLDFGIYDLGEFLGVLSLFEDADVLFEDKVATITEGKSSIRYYAADASLLVVPTQALKYPEPEVTFDLPAATLAMAIKTAGVLRSSDITIEGDGTTIHLSVADLKNPSANNFKVIVGETDKTFKANLKQENLKMAPGDYTASLSSKMISRFQSKTSDAVFYIALESTSTFAK
jgi:hypothetical protein